MGLVPGMSAVDHRVGIIDPISPGCQRKGPMNIRIEQPTDPRDKASGGGVWGRPRMFCTFIPGACLLENKKKKIISVRSENSSQFTRRVIFTPAVRSK